MKTRTTLLLASLAAGFFAYLWFVDRHQQSTQDAAESAAKVLSFEREKLDSLTLRNSSTQIELRKKDGVWRMEQPHQDRADAAAVDRLLNLLEGLRHEAKIDLPKAKEQELLKEFGLSDSETVLKLKASSGKEIDLLLGKDSAIAGKLYMQQRGQHSAFVIRNELRGRVNANADEYRDHRLSATPVSSVERLTIRSGEGEIELQRKGMHWDLLRPMRARAASSKINDLLAGMLTAQVSQFLPESPSPEQGLAEPRATITALVEGQKEPLVLQIGATPGGEENKERSFAKLSGRPAVTVLPNTALDPLLKAHPNHLRDRKLVRVEPDIVDRITFESKDAPPLILMRKGESWTYLEGENVLPVKEGMAGKVLASILGAEAVDFVADLTTDLGQYGLSDPQLRVRLSSFASENTAESKSGENPIVTLLFGKVEGESCYVKLEDEPFIVAAEKSLLASLPLETFDVLPTAAPEPVLELKLADIVGVELAPKDAPAVRLDKADGVWKPSAGEVKPDESAIEALLARVATLRAGRRTGQHAPIVRSLKTSLLTLKIRTETSGVQASHILTVGTPLKDGTFPTTVSGREGVFLLSSEDIGALQKKLLP
jgi:hypothetical protein